eukprot:3863815-Alexandrium_andersonii.AAC.1
MSASLVGSEMCIRDSTMENEFEVFVHTNLTNVWQHTLRREYGPTTRDRVCLLYTSDAADDM